MKFEVYGWTINLYEFEYREVKVEENSIIVVNNNESRKITFIEPMSNPRTNILKRKSVNSSNSKSKDEEATTQSLSSKLSEPSCEPSLKHQFFASSCDFSEELKNMQNTISNLLQEFNQHQTDLVLLKTQSPLAEEMKTKVFNLERFDEDCNYKLEFLRNSSIAAQQAIDQHAGLIVDIQDFLLGEAPPENPFQRARKNKNRT